MPARRRRPSAFCSIRARTAKSARRMKAPPPWTGWLRSRSAASPLPPLRRPATGRTIASTSSTLPATSISPSRSSVPCAFWTALSPCSARRAALSRSPRLFGVRPSTIMFRAWCTSTRWTSWARTSTAWWTCSTSVCTRMRIRFSCRSARRTISAASSTC